MNSHTGHRPATIALKQLCAIRRPRAACGPVEGFMRPSLSFRCSKSISYSDNLSLFWQFDLTYLMQVVFSATISRLLPLQLGFERFQYISLS